MLTREKRGPRYPVGKEHVYYTILYYAILYYTVLYYTVLYYTVLKYISIYRYIQQILQALYHSNRRLAADRVWYTAELCTPPPRRGRWLHLYLSPRPMDDSPAYVTENPEHLHVHRALVS